MDRSKAFLWDVQNAISDVQSFLSGCDEESYLSNAMLQAAVERKFQIIGDALTRLSKADPSLASEIPDLRQIVGFRNVLVHGYAMVEHATVYAIARQRLPDLHTTITAMLARP